MKLRTTKEDTWCCMVSGSVSTLMRWSQLTVFITCPNRSVSWSSRSELRDAARWRSHIYCSRSHVQATTTRSRVLRPLKTIQYPSPPRCLLPCEQYRRLRIVRCQDQEESRLTGCKYLLCATIATNTLRPVLLVAHMTCSRATVRRSCVR